MAPVLEPATAQVSPKVVLKALQVACDARDWAQVEQLLLQNPTAFRAGAAGVLTLNELRTEQVWDFCRCLPAGVALPPIEFEDCHICSEKNLWVELPVPKLRYLTSDLMTGLTSHLGLRKLGFRKCELGRSALSHLADGAEQRKKRGDRGLQVLYFFDCETSDSYSDKLFSRRNMARLIASSPHLKKLMISGQDGTTDTYGFHPNYISLSEAIGALGGLKDLQTLVIKSLGTVDEDMATQWRELAKNPPPITTIALVGWNGVRGEFGVTRSEAWVDGLKAFCEFVARIPGCVTVELGEIRSFAECNFMQMLGDALNSRTEPFNLHTLMGGGKYEPGFSDGWRNSGSISTQTAILEQLSESAPVHSLQVVLGADEWNKDSTPVRVITGVLNRIGGLQRLVLDNSNYKPACSFGEQGAPSAHDVRSDLLVAIDAHPGLSSLVLRPEHRHPEEDPDWKRLILRLSIPESIANEMVRQSASPLGNIPSELTRFVLGVDDDSSVADVRWAGQTLAQLNRQNYNRWVEFWNARTPQSVASPFFKQLTPLAPGNSDQV